MFALAHAALLQCHRPRLLSYVRCWGLPCLLLALLCTLLAPSPVHACGPVDGGATSCNGDNGGNVASQGNTSGTDVGAGNPINVMTGNKYQREVDLPALPGVLGLEIVRHYNSAYSGPTLRAGAFGRGWKLSYETELFDVAGKVQVVQADGSRILFDRDPSRPDLCASRNPANGNMVLRRQADGRTEYDWTWTDGRLLHFNAAGRLETIRAASGETVHLLYDSRKLLVRVIDPSNRSLSLIYPDQRTAAQGYAGVAHIDSPVGRFSYEYGAAPAVGAELVNLSVRRANLARVRLPTSYDATMKAHAYANRGTTISTVSRLYHYEDGRFTTLLTGISVETLGGDGKPVLSRYATFGYDQNGRANLSTHAGDADKITLSTPIGGQTILTNSLGQQTVYRHAIIGGEHRLLEVRGAGCALCGAVNVRYQYDGLGRLTDTIQLNRDGQPLSKTHFELDRLGRTVEVSDLTWLGGKAQASQWRTRYEYAGNQFAPSAVVRPSVVQGKETRIEISYNRQGQPLQVQERGWAPDVGGKGTIALARATAYRYGDFNGRSLLTRIDGPLPNGPTNSPLDSDITVFEYDHRPDTILATATPAASGQLALYEDRPGILTRIIAPGKLVTDIVDRDDASRPTRVIAPGGIELGYGYDPLGHVTKLSQAGIEEYLSYNALGQLKGVVQATGQRLHFAYGGDGRVSELFDAQNNRIRLTRDTEGRLIARTLLNPDGSVAQQGELSGAPLNAQAPTAQQALAGSAANGERTGADALPDAIFASGDLALRLTYDRLRRLTQLTDARQVRTGYLYDDFGRLIRVDSPDGGDTVFAYDGADRLTSKTTAAGTAQAQTITYRYDSAGRVIAQVTPEGTTTIGYGAYGKPIRIDYPAGREQYEYDRAARLTRHTRTIDGSVITTAYAYDKRGQLIRKTLPDGQVLQYRYHGAIHPKAGLLAAITRQDLFGATVLLDGLNDADDGYASQRYRLANGLDYLRQLDRSGHLTRIGSPGVWEERQQHDALDQLTRRMPLQAAAATNNNANGIGYGWDGAGRLSDIVPAANDSGSARSYRYDAGGNLLAATFANQLTRYTLGSGSNRILARQSGQSSLPYAYNGAGSVTRIGDSGYVWDSQQRLIRIEQNGRPVADYAYNAFGERISKVRYTGNQRRITYYFYDGSELSAEAEPADGAIAISRQYVWLRDQQGNRPIAMLQTRAGDASLVSRALRTTPFDGANAAGAARQSEVLAIVADHTGAPRALVDEQRRIVWRAGVTGFGEAVPEPGNIVAFNLRGSNQYFDEESGLHYNTRRYLDPVNGRYLSADPSGLAGGLNLYAFAANNPLDNIDSNGLQSRPVSAMSFNDKLAKVFELAVPKVPGDVGQILKDLASTANIASTASVFSVWGALQLSPIGWVADGALIAFAYYEFGAVAVDLIKGLVGLIGQVNNANCTADLDAAAQSVSKTIASVSVNVAAGVLLKNVVSQTSRVFGNSTAPPSGKKLQTADPKQIGKKAAVVESAGFKAQGLEINPTKFPDGVKLITELKNKGLSKANAEKAASDLIQTGSTLPIATTITKSTTLYKFVPKGKIPGAKSEYWLSEAEMNALKANPSNIPDRLGLPSWSTASSYDIYAITPIGNATVFKSRVATTKEVMSDGSIVTRDGGAIQTLVPNRELFMSAVKVGSTN